MQKEKAIQAIVDTYEVRRTYEPELIGRRSLVLSALLLGVLVMRPVFTWLLRSAQDNELRWSSLTMPASFVIGSIASYWMIDRIAGFWS